MNLRWLWFDYIDPQLGLLRTERNRVLNRAAGYHTEIRFGFGSRYLFNVAMLLIVIGSATSLWALLPRIPWPPNPAMICVAIAVIAFIGWWLWSVTWHQWRFQPWIWSALRDYGHEVCGSCGYMLRGLGDDVKNCPECGAAREPMPTTGEPSVRVGSDDRGEEGRD